MSRNDADWHLVGYDRDPVPASRFDVEDVAKDFSDRGAVMEEAAGTLKAIADLDGWTGKSAKKFAEKAEEAHEDLGKAAEKYIDAGSALTLYADDVQDAQVATWKAVKAAEQAEKDRIANQDSLLEGEDDPSDELKDDDKQRDKDHKAAVGALEQAKKDLEAAMSALDTAAGNAAARINKASKKFKDSKMDNIKGFVAAAIDVLNVIAVVILAVIVIILIVATCGGFLGVVLAAGGIIATLSTIGTIVGAAILTLTLVQVSMGEADWGDVGLATLGVIGGPIGKLGGKFAAPALARMTALARTTAAASARGSLSYRIAGLAQRIPIGPIRQGLADFRAGLVSDAVRGVTTTLTNVSNKLRPIGTVTDFDAAGDTLAQLRALSNMADQLPSNIRTVQIAAGVQSLGGIATVAGQGNDIRGFGESVTNTFDNLMNLPDVFTIDVADRSTEIVEVGR